MEKSNLWKTYEVMQQKPNEKNEIKFFIQLANTIIYIPISKEVGKVVIIAKGNKRFIPVFTSMEEAQKANVTTNEFTSILFNDIDNFIFNIKYEYSLKGVVLNPLNENIVIEKNILLKMYNYIEESNIKNNFFSDLQLVVPGHVPKNIATELENLVSEEIDFLLIRFNLYKSRRNLSDSYHWLVFIKFLGDKNKLLPYISDIMRRNIKANEVFEICIYSGELDFLYTLDETTLYKII